MNLQRAHRYVQSIFFSALVAHENKDYIVDTIEDFYSELTEAPKVHRKKDYQVVTVKTATELIIGHNGTQDSSDWVTDFNALCTDCFHRGIANEYFGDVSPIVLDFVAGTSRPIKNYGHSQGSLEAQLATLDLREHGHDDVETISFCGPFGYTAKGVARMKAAKCRVTEVLMPDDLVSKVGGIVFGKKWPFVQFAQRYGKIVKLPGVDGKTIMEHAWSNVMESLKKLMGYWNKEEQGEYIDAIKHVCKK